jgi:hypothetical protein
VHSDNLQLGLGCWAGLPGKDPPLPYYG